MPTSCPHPSRHLREPRIVAEGVEVLCTAPDCWQRFVIPRNGPVAKLARVLDLTEHPVNHGGDVDETCDRFGHVLNRSDFPDGKPAA